MAKDSMSPGHVSGFVKQLKNHSHHGNMTFSVLDKDFILPVHSTTFTDLIRSARQNKKNVLILYKEMDGVAPEITGVVVSPLWAQRAAAQNGQSYDEIMSIGFTIEASRMLPPPLD